MNFVVAVQALTDAGVEFAIIGGWSAIMHGSAHLTNDLDLCYSRNPDNLPRLALALAPYHPRPADFPRINAETQRCAEKAVLTNPVTITAPHWCTTGIPNSWQREARPPRQNQSGKALRFLPRRRQTCGGWRRSDT
jgi:hypothetical protein